jgi:predicted ferric reductase
MKKILFILSIAAFSIVSTLAVASIFYAFSLLVGESENATGTLTKASVYLFFLKLTGTLALVFIGIATIIGASRNWIFSFYKNTDFWKIHTRWASSFGIAFAISHLTIYLLYNSRLKIPFSLKLFAPNFAKFTSTSNLIFISTTALIIFIVNMLIAHYPGITGKKWWKPLHIFNYLGFFLVMLHAFYIGSDSSSLIFIIFYIVLLILALGGTFHRLFNFTKKFKKTNTPPPESNNATQSPTPLAVPSKPETTRTQPVANPQPVTQIVSKAPPQAPPVNTPQGIPQPTQTNSTETKRL